MALHLLLVKRVLLLVFSKTNNEAVDCIVSYVLKIVTINVEHSLSSLFKKNKLQKNTNLSKIIKCIIMPLFQSLRRVK
jgi:hypothetical protein